MVGVNGMTSSELPGRPPSHVEWSMTPIPSPPSLSSIFAFAASPSIRTLSAFVASAWPWIKDDPAVSRWAGEFVACHCVQEARRAERRNHRIR